MTGADDQIPFQALVMAAIDGLYPRFREDGLKAVGKFDDHFLARDRIRHLASFGKIMSDALDRDLRLAGTAHAMKKHIAVFQSPEASVRGFFLIFGQFIGKRILARLRIHLVVKAFQLFFQQHTGKAYAFPAVVAFRSLIEICGIGIAASWTFHLVLLLIIRKKEDRFLKLF